MTEDELVATYPRLWHMAHGGGWPSIRDRGLMSASALLDAYGVAGDARAAVESARRPASVPLARAGWPVAVIRDQGPMTDARLAMCLRDGLSPKDWYEILNRRTFFWLSRPRVRRLLKAKAYRNLEQTVLTIDTAGLVAAHRDRVRLSPINSGSTLFTPQPRGHATFRRIADFPFAERSRTRRAEDNAVELLVDDAVPDIAAHVLAVHAVRGDHVLAQEWRSARATDDDRP